MRPGPKLSPWGLPIVLVVGLVGLVVNGLFWWPLLRISLIYWGLIGGDA